jgi:DNA invertase Pin-like site-specific DNA recombinase
LTKAIKTPRPGDTLVTVRLDRLARSIRDLLSLLDAIKASGAYIKALDDPWLDKSEPPPRIALLDGARRPDQLNC